MVSNYELIEKLEKLPFFNSLLKNGIIPINWIDYKVIYEFYLEELKVLEKRKSKKIKSQAITNTAIEFSISEPTVYWIVRKMR